jgi:hypothetical protein
MAKQRGLALIFGPKKDSLSRGGSMGEREPNGDDGEAYSGSKRDEEDEEDEPEEDEKDEDTERDEVADEMFDAIKDNDRTAFREALKRFCELDEKWDNENEEM